MKNMSAVTDIAANIRMLLMDVDGVLTDGKVFGVPDPSGAIVETKGFDTQDGIALQWLSWKGLVTGVISGRVSPATEARAQQCNMTYVYQGHIEKIPIVEEILKRSGIAASQVADIGDDLTDVVVMNRVGLSIAPANARPEVKRCVQHVTESAGGQGAVREVVRAAAQGARPLGRYAPKIRNNKTEMSEPTGIVVVARSGPGVLHELTGVIARHNGDIASVSIIEEQPESRIYFEINLPETPEVLQADLVQLPSVRKVDIVKTLQKVYGKRIIIVGGGAQVGQVAIGAISEADRHNIRGEHISVDTIPLVGEQVLADAVRAVGRLSRARALVLAGALMGGDIEKAVREVRAQGLLVISLNMAGSVPDASDLVVTDPVQAGVMAVMAIADTAKFTVARLSRRVF